MRALALPAIRFYQRHVSPYKGFCCAYRVHTGRASCSTLGLRAIRRHGLFTGLGILRRRLSLCGVAHRRFGPDAAPARQRGSAPCDIPCDPSCADGCDAPDLDCRACSRWCGACDCGGGGCDGPLDRKPEERRRRREAERGVHLPPRRAGAQPSAQRQSR